MQVTHIVCCCSLLGPLAGCFLHTQGLLGKPDPVLTGITAAFGTIAGEYFSATILGKDVELIGQAVFAPPRFASEGIHCAMGTSLEQMEKRLAADWPHLTRSA
jgi:hypothetical protein